MPENIKKYQFKDGLPLEFEIVDLKSVFEQKKEMMSTPHRAQFFHIILIEKGKGTHFVDFKPIEIEDHLAIFMPANCVNAFDKEGEYEGTAIIFTAQFFCKNEQDSKFLNSSILFSDLYDTATLRLSKKAKDFYNVLNAMKAEFAKETDAAQYHILHNMLHVLLLQSEREMRKQGFEELKPSQNLDYLLEFKAKLEEHFKNEKSVNWYASELYLSEKQLYKITTSLLEKTPKQIIDERVLLETKRLLVHTTLSVKEIAYNMGYEEPTNFIKYFKKHTQITPAEFRELN
jgi:AraC-like DNA-binding protein